MSRPSTRTRISFFWGALLFAAGASAPPVHAADQKAILAKVKARYEAAATAYDDGQLEKAETQLKQALKLAEDNGLGENKLVAQTYLLYGVLEVAGFKDRGQGIKYFGKAIDISPAIQIPPTMASKAVLTAFDKAENQAGETTPDEPDAESEQAPSAKRAEPPKSAPAARGDAERDKLVDDLAAAKVSESLQQADKEKLQRQKQEQDKELAGVKGRAQDLARQVADADKQLADARVKVHDLESAKEDRDRQITDLKARLAQVTKDLQDQEKQLAASQASDKKERESGNKLAHDKSETDRQLADQKRNLQELTRQKAETDKQLAAARDEAKRERDAKEKLAHDKADSDRQLADQKRNLLELTRQKAETDKQLAAARDEAKRERDAKEKLIAASREADAREAQRKNKESEEQTAREKLAEGPDLPSHVTEPIACTVPDEVPSGADLYVHCVPRPSINAKVVALYYRSGGVLYNVSTMDRSKKGWFTAVIPGGKLAGKVLHYYVEARDGRQDVVGSNGRANSPNIATIRPGKR
ncbi:MAG TPA: hypothetical protein VN853_18055 [Polyangia bacterium]|nr:hypothetical protein [Polyangia bacterium]